MTMENKQSADIRRTLIRRCAMQGIPASGTLELTPRCNLKCKMCYIRLNQQQMKAIGRERSANEWLSLAREAVDSGMMFLLLTGGEPTIREDFSEIYEGLMNMGLSISINTNATMLTQNIRELFHRLPPAQVNVTVYGTCREDYAMLCGDADAFERMCDGIRWLRSEGILVHLNTTITPANIEHWLQLEEFAEFFGAQLRITAYCFPPVRRENCNIDDFMRLSPEAAGELIVKDLYYREGADTVLRYADSINSSLTESCNNSSGEPINCMAGRSQFWINWYGGMTPCGMLNEPITYPFENGFSDAWKLLQKEVDSIFLCADCVKCKDRATCMSCAAVIYAETGSFDRKPEYVCKMNASYRSSIIQLSEKIKNNL